MDDTTGSTPMRQPMNPGDYRRFRQFEQDRIVALPPGSYDSP